MNLKYFIVLLLVFGLVSCAEEKQQTRAGASSGEELAAQLREADLPENTPAVGTAVTELVKPADNAELASEISSTVKKIMWEDLVPGDYRPEKIMQKYQAQIQEIEEGSPEERELYKIMMAEFDNAPTNEKLDGIKVRIPGFVSPLDQTDGVVSEFLLVPSFGSCIHSPPPPVNQTILVKPQEGKSVTLDEIYEPVWVTGYIKAEAITTSLAKAGYRIEGAQLEKYTGEN